MVLVLFLGRLLVGLDGKELSIQAICHIYKFYLLMMGYKWPRNMLSCGNSIE
jgi:hypothetical protein